MNETVAHWMPCSFVVLSLADLPKGGQLPRSSGSADDPRNGAARVVEIPFVLMSRAADEVTHESHGCVAIWWTGRAGAT
jgi:hypothetical protein